VSLIVDQRTHRTGYGALRVPRFPPVMHHGRRLVLT
jgi:hypothetical protein